MEKYQKIKDLSVKYILMLVSLFLLSCGSNQSVAAATPEQPFRGMSKTIHFENKGYLLVYKKPDKLKLKKKEKNKHEYTFADCDFVVYFMPYQKSIPKYAYYRERISYQRSRVRNKISKTLAGNSMLGGTRKTYYYLKEIRINKKTGEKKYLLFFERYVDRISGPHNVLVKMVLRAYKKSDFNADMINTAAFIFRTYKIKYVGTAAE